MDIAMPARMMRLWTARTRIACFLTVIMPFAVFARTLLVPTQPVSPYLDTEVSTNCVLHRSRIDARTFDVHFQFEGTPTNNLEVAFGRDSNTNGVLDVQEIDTVYGWRGGRYFIENVRAWERIETVAATNALWNPPVAEGDQVGRMSEANEGAPYPCLLGRAVTLRDHLVSRETTLGEARAWSRLLEARSGRTPSPVGCRRGHRC